MSSPLSGPPGRSPSQLRPRGRSRALLPTAIVLAVLLLLFQRFTELATEWLWFRSVDFTAVMRTQLFTKAGLFVVFGLILGVAVAANFVAAYRTRPVYALISPEQQSLERYRSSLAPYLRWIVLAVGLLFGLLGGSSAAAQWETFLLWRNSTPFGTTDPQFGKDISFYVFSLPWWTFLLSFILSLLVLSLIAAAVTHYLYGGLRLQGAGERTTAAARVHFSLLLGLFVLTKAVIYWLDRFNLSTKQSTVGNNAFTGLRYTDANALLNAKTILAAISVICAILFFSVILRRTWLLPGIAMGLLLASAVLIGGVLPAVVQWFQVRPSELARETPYIERNIQSTRVAYDIDDTEVIDYDPTKAAQPAVRTAAQQVPGVRLLDPYVMPPTFVQQQQHRPYYRFPNILDIGRADLDGQRTDIALAARELNPAQVSGNWTNEHLVFTHGYGLVAARSDRLQPNGSPDYLEQNVPPTGQLGPYEPRIYFGEFSPDYSIVGGPRENPGDLELDYAEGNREVKSTYRGAGGVPVGSFWNRLMYAIKYQEENILLSSQINDESRILYDRHPRERVQKVAPWLTLDSDPYPAVVDGKVQWIVDGYTTSANYPYSAYANLEEATEDSFARRNALAQQPPELVNYIRNSVKATVDAYDGTVRLYAWDDQDPVLAAWRKAFPDVVRPSAEMSDSLRRQVRYPQDMFKVQRTLLGNYHQQVPAQFYSGSDFWQVPVDPSADSAVNVPAAGPAIQNGVRQPPYYLTVQLPGDEGNKFALTTTYVPRNRPNPLTAFAAVGAEAGEDYGKIRVLRMTTARLVPAPGQFVADWRRDVEIQRELVGPQATREITPGNALTLPVAGGLVYVMPVYARVTSGENPYPLLIGVSVSLGDAIGFGSTYSAALNDLPATGSTPPPGGGGGLPPASGTPPPTGTPTGTASPSPGPPPAGGELGAALADARRAREESDAALRDGPDWGRFGEAQKRLADALARAERAAVAGPPR